MFCAMQDSEIKKAIMSLTGKAPPRNHAIMVRLSGEERFLTERVSKEHGISMSALARAGLLFAAKILGDD